MKRFSLLMKISTKVVEEEILPFLDHNCDTCESKDSCKMTKNVAVMFHNDYKHLKQIIDDSIITDYATHIVLIDNQKDIGYIYKGDGDITFIKKNVLPEIFKWYEVLINGNVVLTEIKDLREVGGPLFVKNKVSAEA